MVEPPSPVDEEPPGVPVELLPSLEEPPPVSDGVLSPPHPSANKPTSGSHNPTRSTNISRAYHRRYSGWASGLLLSNISPTNAHTNPAALRRSSVSPNASIPTGNSNNATAALLYSAATEMFQPAR